MVKVYRIPWRRRVPISLLFYLRDWVINILPARKLPVFLVRLIYGFWPDFIFYIHPRRSEDIFVALPFLTIFRKYISKTKLLRIFAHMPCFVLGKITHPDGPKGLIISSLVMPEILLANRRFTLKEAFVV